MKIAIWHNLPSGGGKRALYDQVLGLVARGHTIEAWCPPTADRDFLPLSSVIPEHVVDLAWPHALGLLDKLGITSVMERQVTAMDAHCRLCAADMSARGFELLFAGSCMFFRTTSIARFTRMPSVLYLGEPYRWLYEALPRLPWLAPPRRKGSILAPSGVKAAVIDFRNIRNLRFQAREEVDNARAFNRILVNSYFSRESVLRAYGLESDVCYLGINTDRFKELAPQRQHILVGLGSATPEKNIRFCLEAIALTQSPHPRLVWIGNMAAPGYLADMIDLAQSRGVEFEPRIKVSDEELLEVLSQALAMLYAPRLEPFGLAPLEANACSVPVIAVAEGGVRETIVDQVNGLLVDGTPLAMARAIDRLSDDPALARRLGATARAEVFSNWNMNAAIDRLESILDQTRSLDRRTNSERSALEH